MTANERVAHTHFVVERLLATSPQHAFLFWSQADMKARWSGCHPDWRVLEDTFDFRVGGGEAKRWQTPEGKLQTFNAYYLDIVPDQRIVYAYEMSFAGERLSASLVTIAFEAAGRKTRMTYTEQVAILAGGATAIEPRVVGTQDGLDRLVSLAEEDEAQAGLSA